MKSKSIILILFNLIFFFTLIHAEVFFRADLKIDWSDIDVDRSNEIALTRSIQTILKEANILYNSKYAGDFKVLVEIRKTTITQGIRVDLIMIMQTNQGDEFVVDFKDMSIWGQDIFGNINEAVSNMTESLNFEKNRSQLVLTILEEIRESGGLLGKRTIEPIEKEIIENYIDVKFDEERKEYIMDLDIIKNNLINLIYVIGSHNTMMNNKINSILNMVNELSNNVSIKDFSEESSEILRLSSRKRILIKYPSSFAANGATRLIFKNNDIIFANPEYSELDENVLLQPEDSDPPDGFSSELYSFQFNGVITDDNELTIKIRDEKYVTGEDKIFVIDNILIKKEK